MRLFIAADLSNELLEALSTTSAILRDSIKGRPVPYDMFHVTLAFLGEVEQTKISKLEAIIEKVAGSHSSFDITLSDYGSFGKASKATLWQGFASNDELAYIGNQIRSELDGSGFDYDNKPLLPHVTLMRYADLQSSTLPSPCIAKGKVYSITLYSSERDSQRAYYEPIITAKLRNQQFDCHSDIVV